MEKIWTQGNLTEIPFAQLLFSLWQKEKSGYLKIKKDTIEKKLYFEKGRIAAERGSYPEKDFLQILVNKNLLNSLYLKKPEAHSTLKKSSLIRPLIEDNSFSPSRIWKLMEIDLKARLFPLFNWPQGEYSFDSKHLPQESEVLFNIQTLDFILQGMRRMDNYDIIKAHIPSDNETVQILTPSYLNKIRLDPYEKYFLNLIDREKKLKTIYESSELGKKESQKVVFTLLSLELIGLSPEKSKENIPHQSSPVELMKTLDTFNKKCTYIYKYLSKEIGPVAMNIIKKCLEETKAHLSPFFEKTQIRPDGSINVSNFLKTNISLWTKEEKKNFLKDLNEILAAEVLTVKKTLGSNHESALVKNLEKIGS